MAVVSVLDHHTTVKRPESARKRSSATARGLVKPAAKPRATSAQAATAVPAAMQNPVRDQTKTA